MYAVVRSKDQLMVVADSWLMAGATRVALPPMHCYPADLECRADPGDGYTIATCEVVAHFPTLQHGNQYIMDNCRRKSNRARTSTKDPNYDWDVENISAACGQAQAIVCKGKRQHQSSTPDKPAKRAALT